MQLLCILIIITIISTIFDIITKKENKKENIEIQNNKIDYNNYYTNKKVMTPGEEYFFKELKKMTNKLDLYIFPQVNMERYINVKKTKEIYSYRNRIKSRCIDYLIIKNDNTILCGIELDDKSHEKNERIKRDEFINTLFDKINIQLFRIPQREKYNMEILENKLKELL